MKKLTHSSAISIIALLSSFGAMAEDSAQKIGYINTAQVFETLPQRATVLKKLQDEFKDRADELQALQVEAATKSEQFQKDAELLEQSAIEALRLEIAQLETTYRIKGEALEQDSKIREMEEQKELFLIIQASVKDIAETEQYDLIVDIQALQYGKPENDISNLVIESLQKENPEEE